ncbi:MAG: hypothetical protein OEW56_13255, partial [Gemmatimonadota bacterium]|nr:hypothetical protein [Gemmatimonadota bacterium]
MAGPGVPPATPLGARLMGLVGLATMIGIAWLLSNNRRRVPWRLVATGVALQAVLGFIVLKTGFGRALFTGAAVVFTRLLGFTQEGARFVFGNLVHNNVPVGTPSGAPADMAPLADPSLWAATGAYFAFSVLPTIIFFSALTSVLYHLGIMQRVVQGMAWGFQRVLGTSGA